MQDTLAASVASTATTLTLNPARWPNPRKRAAQDRHRDGKAAEERVGRAQILQPPTSDQADFEQPSGG